jgi:4-amino-4-deoxy-L-arabinose transferase-like glycosyltransferase
MRRTSQLAIIISIIAVGVRLIAINQPFVDNWSWRQSDVAAIARNYFQGGFHFAHPQIDWAGDQPGYVGTEFPILPFLAALFYKFLGTHEWVGRMQAVVFFAISLPFFFLLARKVLGEIGATWALLFYSFAPLGIMASRCFMPDTPSLVLSIIGLYFFERWINSDHDSPSFFLAAIAISLSILIKLPSAIIGAPLAYLAFQRFGSSAFRNIKLWIFAGITLLPATLWYWYAYQVSLKFYPHHFFGAGGVKMMPPAWYWKIAQEVPTLALTPVIFIVAGIGLFTARSISRARPFYWWLAAMVLFIIVVGYGNRHPWYRLPLVPIAALFGGSACAFIGTRISSRAAKFAGSILVLVLLNFSALVSARIYYHAIAAPLRDAGLTLEEITPENSLIAAADNGDPTVLYYGKRKGWHFLEKDGIYYGDPDGSEPAIADLQRLREKGAKYVVFTSNTDWWLDLYPEFREYLHENSALIAATSRFSIYRLDPISK